MNNPTIGTTEAKKTPTIPEQPVPWDQAELQGRNCGSCACYFESFNPADPTKFQGFCRKAPANMVNLRAEVPRLDRNQQPVFKDGQPVMNSEVIQGYLYQFTQKSGTCFDGYRPKGTLPGDQQNTVVLRAIVPILLKAIKKVGTTIPPDVEQSIQKLLSIPPDESN